MAFICLQNGCCAKPPSQDFCWIFSSFFFSSFFASWNVYMNGKNDTLLRVVWSRSHLLGARCRGSCSTDSSYLPCRQRGGRIGWEQRDIRQKGPGILYLHRVSFFFLAFLMSQGYKGPHKDNGAMVYTCFLSTQAGLMPHRSFIWLFYEASIWLFLFHYHFQQSTTQTARLCQGHSDEGGDSNSQRRYSKTSIIAVTRNHFILRSKHVPRPLS